MNVPLTAGEICSRTVVCADRGVMLDEAARLMRTPHVGSLVVVEERSPKDASSSAWSPIATSRRPCSRWTAIPTRSGWARS